MYVLNSYRDLLSHLSPPPEVTTATSTFSKSLHCCIRGCYNSNRITPHLKFHAFPSANKNFPIRAARRQAWLNACDMPPNADGSAWQPRKRTRVCSAHFAGGRKSDIYGTKGYIPTIFPTRIYKVRPKEAEKEVRRMEKELERRRCEIVTRLKLEGEMKSKEREEKEREDEKLMEEHGHSRGGESVDGNDSGGDAKVDDEEGNESSGGSADSEVQVEVEEEEEEEIEVDVDTVDKVDASCQVNLYNAKEEDDKIVIVSNRFIYPEKSEVETQVNSPAMRKRKKKAVFKEDENDKSHDRRRTRSTRR